MRCYFYARSDRPTPHQEGPGIIAFCIPDLGITYRAALRATPSELPYRALQGLLKFLESNRRVCERQKLELLTDCAPLIYQVLGHMVAPARVRQDLGSVRIKKRQLGFTLHWVAEEDNRARENIAYQPVARPAPQLNFSSLQDLTLAQRAAGWKESAKQTSRPNKM
jgi:hypothetical protein